MSVQPLATLVHQLLSPLLDYTIFIFKNYKLPISFWLAPYLQSAFCLISSVCFTFTAFHSWLFIIIVISTLLNSFSFPLQAQNLTFHKPFPPLYYRYLIIACLRKLVTAFRFFTLVGLFYFLLSLFLVSDLVWWAKLAIHRFSDRTLNTCISYRIVWYCIASTTPDDARDVQRRYNDANVD